MNYKYALPALAITKMVVIPERLLLYTYHPKSLRTRNFFGVTTQREDDENWVISYDESPLFPNRKFYSIGEMLASSNLLFLDLDGKIKVKPSLRLYFGNKEEVVYFKTFDEAFKVAQELISKHKLTIEFINNGD